MQYGTRFDVHSMAGKLRRAAAELRGERRYDFSTEQFARRLEAHADAMLRPEVALHERFLTLRETRLLGLASR
jgi:hypothetical protein